MGAVTKSLCARADRHAGVMGGVDSGGMDVLAIALGVVAFPILLLMIEGIDRI